MARAATTQRGAAARASRDPKPSGEIDLEAARADWRARAAEHGLGRAGLAALVEAAMGRAGRLSGPAPDPGALLRRLAGPDGLTARRNSFTRADVVREVAGAHPQGIAANEAQALADRFLAGNEVIALAAERYTVRDLLRAEERLVGLREEGTDARRGVLPRALVEEVLTEASAAGRGLGPDQAAVVRALASSGRALEVVQAHAGTGKTYTLGVLAECYRRAGYEVVGARRPQRGGRASFARWALPP